MNLLSNPRFLGAVRALFWLAMVLAVTMATLPKPPKLYIDRYGDKAEHMLAFATLAVLGTIGFGLAQRWRLAERLSFLGALIEVVQSIPALHRDCDIHDWLADTLAIIVATVLTGYILPYFTKVERG